MLTLRIDYAYDAFDQLIRRGTDNDGPGGYAPQNKFYAYEDGQIVLGFEYSGMLTSRFLWGPQTDQLLVHESGIFNGAGTPYFPLADQQNTIHDAAQYNSSTGTSAVVIHRYGDAYSSGGSWSNFDGSSYDGGSFAYTGRFTDIYMTGLQWNLHRWYDPYTGRWMSEDPIGFAGGDTNLSRYVFNNPVSLTDPSGLAAAGNETGWDHAVNCMAGFSDIATLGIAPGIRWLFGYDPGIDRSSGWYWGGAAAPVVVATGGAATLPSGIGAAGATTTVFGTTPLFGAGALAAGGAALSRPDVQQLINWV